MAAVLACGSRGLRSRDPNESASGPATHGILDRWGAALSHRSAAELWGLLRPGKGPVNVSVPGTNGRERRRAIHVHRSRTLRAEMVTSRSGIPVTTPARTLADLRLSASTRGCPASVHPADLKRAIRQAGVLGLSLGPDVTPEPTRSELESLFLSLCRKHRLPRPEVNVPVASFEVDFLWLDRRLIVETDGYRFHRGRAAFESDRNRDLELRALGYEVIRLSYRQVVEEPGRIAAVLRTALTAHASG